jgi:predicted DCC family thiol-disulfide oxidoreductase YuxK
MIIDDSPIILFDGVCNLCNASVRFVLARDPQEVFRFASLQSDLGKSLIEKHQLPTNLSTIVLIEDKKAWVRSSAALRIARHLNGLWPLLRVFLLIPPPLRNGVYRFIARYRYRWFGRQEACPLPDPAHAHRFL